MTVLCIRPLANERSMSSSIQLLRTFREGKGGKGREGREGRRQGRKDKSGIGDEERRRGRFAAGNGMRKDRGRGVRATVVRNDQCTHAGKLLQLLRTLPLADNCAGTGA